MKAGKASLDGRRGLRRSLSVLEYVVQSEEFFVSSSGSVSVDVNLSQGGI